MVASRSARRSTTNFTPSGIAVNCVSSRTRGGSSARRSRALAAARSATPVAAATRCQAAVTASPSASKEDSARRKAARPSRSAAR